MQNCPIEGISVVIPVYNSDEVVADLVARVEAVLGALASDYELVLVNDGSSDASWQRIAQLAAERPFVRGVDLMRNFGQHNALLAGIREARHAVVVTLDDDLQNPPEEIPKLAAALTPGVDVVYGTPVKPEHGFRRGVATYLTKLALRSAMGTDVARKVSPFRAFRRDLRDAFASYTGSYVSVDVLLTWGTTRFATVPVRHEPRRAGSSNYTFRKLASHAINMATGFSTRPLRLASLVGFVFAFLGLAVLVEVVVRKLVQGSPVPGFPFLASIIAIFAGAQLFALGIIGEYLARMHFRLMDKPPYAIRERI
ncbi:MAG TPA: glycosyltransferase family 2 protein [Gaiellaceae bacterium]|nr:glycosyltransferase family 2 protein [Gaiellaceae bacterium]